MNNPYIGPRSFVREQRDRFFGRSREARNLLSLVISERLVLFYAQSGAGKTSLLNTSLIPALEENGRAVLPAGRVSGELPAGVDEVENIFVFNLLIHLDQSNTDPARFARMELKDFLEHLSSPDGESYAYDPAEAGDDDDEILLYVLIIDQFEEILTDHPERWQERADFFRQLDQAMRHDPGLFVVLTLREDYVAALESYSPLLTDRMRSRFYMERMERGAALAAVTGPAKNYGRPFAPGAAEALVDNLSLIRSARSVEPRPGQYIEPVQLQVVCYQLWRNLPPGEEITLEQVNQVGDIDNALADFYEQAVAETLLKTEGSELELRQWFDRQLITEAGTRGTVFQGEKVTGGMDNRAVRLLEDRFLLRAESRAGAVWYELVHDRFVEPIRQANQEWLERQGPLLRDALAWKESNKTDQSLPYTGEKLTKTLAERAERNVLEPVITEFLEAGKKQQTVLEEKEKTRKLILNFYRISMAAAFILLLLGLWGTWGSYKAKKALVQLQQAEKLQTGMALNAKAALAENEGSRLYAHLYSLYALDKLGKNNKNSDAYMEAVIRAQANPVPTLAFIGHHADSVRDVDFSPNGLLAASASQDKTIGIWDVQTGIRLNTLEGHTDKVEAVDFSPDGRLLASGSLDKTVGIWDVQSGNRLQTLRGHTDRIRRVAFAPNGRLLASCSNDKTIGIWNVQTGSRRYTLKGKKFIMGGIAFSSDSRNIAATLFGATIGIWDLKTGNLSETLDGYLNALFDISFSPADDILASTSFGQIVLWDTQKKQRLKTLRGGENSLFFSVSFSPDGRTLVTGGFNNLINSWDVHTGQRQWMLQGMASGYRVAFSPDAHTLIASGSSNNMLGFWETNSGRLCYLKGHAGQVINIWFSSDSATVVSVARDKTIVTWNTATGRRLQKTPLRKMTGMDYVLLSPDGRMFASGSYGSDIIRLGEVSTGREIEKFEGHTNEVDNFAFSSDNQFLASASSDKTIKIWDVQTGKCRRTLSVEDEVETSISFSPDGRFFAAGLKNNTISIWDSTTGKRIQTFNGASGLSTFSPDSRLLAVPDSNDHTISIWDISSGQRLQTLKGHKSWIGQLVFSADNLLLASDSSDKTIAIWNVKSGKRIRTLRKDNIGRESTIAFSSDSKKFAFTTDDNAIALWDLEPTVNEFSGISLDENGEYKIDLDTLPYKLEGLELKSIEDKQTGPDKPARWSRYHPFHWLPAAEKGDSDAMLQIGIIYDRNNDIARALRWYGKAVKAGNEQAKKQQDILLHWLEDKENWQTVPDPFRDSFCKAKAEFTLPEKVAELCGEQ